MYDVIIIGAGPAGLTSAIYASRSGMKTLVIEALFSGGQMTSTYEIENYPGVLSVDGPSLSMIMDEQARSCGAEIINESVVSVDLSSDIKTVHTENGEFSAKTVILASGAARRTLGCDGEERLTGHGVSYCATCDGGFYKGKVTAVVGGGDVALEDAIYLSGLAKEVYLIHRRDSFRGTRTLEDNVRKALNIKLMLDSVVDEIKGEDVAQSIDVRNLKTNKVQTIDIDGVFIAVGNKPNTDFVKNILDMDDAGYIKSGEDCKTNIDGVFVAGDLRRKPLYQIVTATSDGAVAAKKAFEFINYK